MALKIWNSAKYYARRFGTYHISTYAASASFFIMTAIFPLLTLALSIISFTPLSTEDLIGALLLIVPKSLWPLATYLAESMMRTSAAALSVSLIAALWSASKSMLGLLDGLNAIADVNDTRNFIFKRIICMGYILVLILGLVVNLGLRVFGQHILELLQRIAPGLAQVFSTLMQLRGLTLFGILALVFLLIYTFFPNKKMKVLQQIPGAMFTSFAWLLFSSLFSIYVNQAATSSLYGSLTTVILAMLWLYFCMYLIFLGAVFNNFWPDLLRWGYRKWQKHRAKKTAPSPAEPSGKQSPGTQA